MPRAASRKSSLMRMMDAFDQAVYLLDEDRKIVFANEALARAIGMALDDIIGRRCRYHTEEGGSQRLLDQLSPPPASWQGEESVGIVTLGAAPHEARFEPILQQSQRIGMLVIVGHRVEESSHEGNDFVTSATDAHQLLCALRHEWQSQFQIDCLIGRSPAMRRVRAQVELASQNTSSVTVVGPIGSGREHVARTIHAIQAGDGPSLVPLSSPILDAELVATTLQAFIRRCAELETATIPTLLLLDADQLSVEAQQELVDFLSVAELELRALSTAQVSLQDLAHRGDFRQDLAEALSTLEVELPSLSEREGDVPLLAQFFVEQHNAEQGTSVQGFAVEAIEQLVAYHWPGNLAELQTLVANCLSDENFQATCVEPQHLPSRIRLALDACLNPVIDEPTMQLEQYLADVESKMIAEALERSNGNKTQAARLLGMNRTRLLRRIQQLQIESTGPKSSRQKS